MSENNFGLNVVLPEHLQKQIEEMASGVVRLLIGTLECMYPNGDVPDDAVELAMSILIPKLWKAVDEAVPKVRNELNWEGA